MKAHVDWLARRWLAKYYSPKKNKMAFVGVLPQIKLPFGSLANNCFYIIIQKTHDFSMGLLAQ